MTVFNVRGKSRHKHCRFVDQNYYFLNTQILDGLIDEYYILLCSVVDARLGPWLATSPSEKRSLTSALTSSPQATAWTPVTTSSSQRRCARATWSRWEGRSSPGRNAGSSLTASKGRSPTTLVRRSCRFCVFVVCHLLISFIHLFLLHLSSQGDPLTGLMELADDSAWKIIFTFFKWVILKRQSDFFFNQKNTYKSGNLKH